MRAMLGGFSLGISGVFVIESLRLDDKLRTGVEVHAGAVSPFGRRAGVYVDPVRIANKPEDLFDHLATIADIVAAKKLETDPADRVPWERRGVRDRSEDRRLGATGPGAV